MCSGQLRMVACVVDVEDEGCERGRGVGARWASLAHFGVTNAVEASWRSTVQVGAA